MKDPITSIPIAWLRSHVLKDIVDTLTVPVHRDSEEATEIFDVVRACADEIESQDATTIQVAVKPTYQGYVIEIEEV